MSDQGVEPTHLPAEVDVLIGGGGPAGTALALQLARRGIVVAVLERTSYDDWRAGETLPPGSRGILERLGVWDAFRSSGHVESHGVRSCWGSDAARERDFIRDPRGGAWHVDRIRFDRLLRDAAEHAGAIVLAGMRIRAARRIASTWHVTVGANNTDRSLRARVLVDATGRGASVARLLGKHRRTGDRSVALVQVLSQAPESPVEPILVIEASENGWWYSVPLPAQQILAGYITDSDLLPLGAASRDSYWCEQLRQTEHTRARVREARPVGALRIRPADGAILDEPASPGFAAVGDAACSFDPLAGSGIARAMRGTSTAADAIVAAVRGDAEALAEYADSIRRDFLAYEVQRAFLYSLEQRWPHSAFWLRRQAQQPVMPMG